jgi:hypothetical protein
LPVAVPIGRAAIDGLATVIRFETLGNLGIVPPKFTSGGRVDGVNLAPSAGHVHDPVDHQGRGLDGAVFVNIVKPSQPKPADVLGVDLGQRTIALFAVGPAVGQPIARLGLGIGDASRGVFSGRGADAADEDDRERAQ